MAIKPIRRMIPMSAIPGTRLENNMIIAVLPRAAVTVFRNIHGSTLCSISSEPFERIIQWIKSFRIASIVTIEDTASHLQRMYSILLSGLEKVRGRMPSLTSLPIMPAAIMKAKLYALSVELILGKPSKNGLKIEMQSKARGKRKKSTTRTILTGLARNCFMVN